MEIYTLKNMNEKRAAHCMVFIEGDLIVIGGLGEDCEILQSCERYSVGDDKWIALPDLNVPAMNPSVCVFNNQFLYKFGGKQSEEKLTNTIERLNLEGGGWEVIKFNTHQIPRLPSSSCCFQINNNSMIFFGGTFNSYSEKSDEIWLCTVKDQNVEVMQLEDRIPSSEGFWMQQAVTHNNSSKLIFSY
jgi:N-acetylneuraminic acid mutarotase